MQPSRARRAKLRVRAGRGEGGGPPPDVAAERAARSPPAKECRAADGVGGVAADADRPAQDAIPVIEIARADTKAEALEGLERWKVRHPEVVPYLEAAGHPGRLDARPLDDLDAGPGQPHPRPRGGPARTGGVGVRLRPVGGDGHRGLEGRDGGFASADTEAEVEGEINVHGRHRGRERRRVSRPAQRAAAGWRAGDPVDR